MPKSENSRWLPIFTKFVSDLRISSKEITGTDERGVKLRLWGSQKLFLRELAFGLDRGIRYFICLKNRQCGCTTVSLAVDVFWMAMHAHLPGALVSDSDKNRVKNRALIEQYVAGLPEGYFGDAFEIRRANNNVIQFSNGSKLDLLVAGTRSKSTAWGEGEGYAFAHLTERSAYADADGIASFEESLAQKNPDRLFISESTAKGYNHYRTAYKAAKADHYTKHAFFIGWWASEMNRIERKDPRFQLYGEEGPYGKERELIAQVRHHYGHEIVPEQLAWYRSRQAEAEQKGDPGLLDQNQPWTEDQAFIASGFSFFAPRVVALDMKSILDSNLEFIAYRYEVENDFFQMRLEYLEPGESRRDDIELKVWEQPVPHGKYVIGCDPAYGRNSNKDRHAIEIYRCYADKLVQVAEFATSGIEVKHCAWILAHLAGAYRDCIVNVEITGPGRMIMLEWEHLKGLLNAEMSTAKVKEMEWEDAMSCSRWYLYHRPDSMGSGYAANFETTWRTKAEIMHQMRGEYATKSLMIRSVELLREMLIVVQDGDSIGAPESRAEDSKDDRVFGTALAIRAWINWVRPQMIAEGQTYEVVTKMDKGEVPKGTQRLNDQVFRWLRTQAEIAEMERERDHRVSWRRELNL
jgi:hypothetical protein